MHGHFIRIICGGKQMNYIRKVPGDKLYLSPILINPNSVKKFMSWYNKLDFSLRLFPEDKIFSLEEGKEKLQELSRGKYNFAIVSDTNNELIGFCGLKVISQQQRIGELSFIFIGDDNYQNRGLGEESVKLLLAYGFEIINFHNIMLKVFAFNKSAIRCYKKCGFKQAGRIRNFKKVGQERYDDIMMDILAKEYYKDINYNIVDSDLRH